MPTYTVRIKGKVHQFNSDLTDTEAIIRLRKLVKKEIIAGPFAQNLLQRALNGDLTPGWISWVQFLATSKKARKEFGSGDNGKEDHTTLERYRNVAEALLTVFGHQGALEGVRDAGRASYGDQRAKWRGVYRALQALPDPDKRVSGKRAVLIED